MDTITITKEQEKIVEQIKGSNLSLLKVDELKSTVKELNLQGSSRMKKDELVELIKNYLCKNLVVQEDFTDKLDAFEAFNKFNSIEGDIEIPDINKIPEKEKLMIIKHAKENAPPRKRG